MNRIYKLKFDKRRNELVVVSEITAGVGKAKATGRVEGVKASRRGVRAMALSLLSGMIMMANPVTAANLPTGGQIVAGSGSIQTPSGNQMNIHQNSQNMVANWNSFDIGKGNTVQFYQPNSSAVALNRVVGGGESKIMGNLKANGQVFLVNPNGVLFGKDASVSTSGFVASTRDIKNDDFMNRRYTFSGGQKAGAEIVNQGALTTNAGGYIVLAADKVSNSGTIRTPGGKTVLAAGERVTLQLDNGGLTSVQVSGDVVNALVENRGLISARDGQVYLTALGQDMLMNTVLNVSGVVEAGGMHRQDGNIVLDGGDSGVVHLSGTLQADNASGQGGKVVVQGQNILLDKGSSITATGSKGGGEVYIGGGWQGKDSSIRNADKVVMQDGARIDVSATQQGNGGTAVLWSESFTNFRGQISAKGGENGGNGGQVETSSHGNLQAFGSVSASAKKGKAGNWLLDPLDITIVENAGGNAANETEENGEKIFSPGSTTQSQVSNTSINNELNNGTSVTILTNSTTSGSDQKGNITVNADINKTSGTDATLTLKADGNINVNKNITSTAGKLNVNLSGANTHDGTVTIANGKRIYTNNGNISIGSGNASNSLNLSMLGSTLNAGTGNISIDATGFVSANSSRFTGGNISITGVSTGQTEALTLNNTEVNASKNINITGSVNGLPTNGRGIFINNSTLNATDTVNINGTGNFSSGVGGANSFVHVQNASITSSAGNITIDGNVSNIESAVFFRDVTLNASQGNISINGTSDHARKHTAPFQGGSVWLYNTNMTAKNTLISATNTNTATDVSASGAALYLAGNLTFTGNTAINATANRGAAITFGSTTAFARNTLNMTFINGTIVMNATNNGTLAAQGYKSAISGDIWNNNPTDVNIKLNDSDLTICASGKNGDGITSKFNRGFWNITGTGNASITGISQYANGISLININASGLNGSTTLTGISTDAAEGAGVFLMNNSLINVTVNGNAINASGNGSGLYIIGNSTLTNSTVNGYSSGTASGVEISGNSTLTNSMLNGYSSGTASGVDISGNSTLTNTTVSGNGTDGSGV
ncbi:filamentous hemagglutinin N-terminal domain-containing protein, partial [Escherichia coli]